MKIKRKSDYSLSPYCFCSTLQPSAAQPPLVATTRSLDRHNIYFLGILTVLHRFQIRL